MEAKENTQLRRILGRWISVGILATAVVLGFVVLHHASRYPRTEDAEVFANFIGIAPQVDGPLIRLNVKDNQFVKKGEPLYEIDEQPYQYALENALSEQAALEGQIADEQRKIAALVSAVSVAEANTHSAEAEILEAERGVAKARCRMDLCEQQSASPGAAPGEAVRHGGPGRQSPNDGNGPVRSSSAGRVALGARQGPV